MEIVLEIREGIQKGPNFLKYVFFEAGDFMNLTKCRGCNFLCDADRHPSHSTCPNCGNLMRCSGTGKWENGQWCKRK